MEAGKILIQWDTSSEPIALIEITRGETLLQLYNKLLKLLPGLKKTWFSFVWQGVPIRSELWDLIEAHKLEPVAQIKEGFYDFVRRTQIGSIAKAQYDFHMDPNPENKDFVPLDLKEGENVVVYAEDSSNPWWYGAVVDRQVQYGHFPSNHVTVVQSNTQ
jgi:hypothetical protein